MSMSFALGLVEMGFIMSVVSHFTFTLRDGVSGPNFRLGILLIFISWCLALRACQYLLMDMAAIRPGNRGKAPECYTYLEADHHHFMEKTCDLGILAIIFGGCSSKLLSPPPPPPPPPPPVAS
ncbi:hypothetical protein D1007_58739 [Hordeum vulgare]|nr:hypothetical protein D1007_58739 [Hordeum vulgare]